MSWLYFALISYFLAAVLSRVLDKVILKRAVPQPVVYAPFYVGLFGLYGLLLVPFGFRLEEVTAAPAACFRRSGERLRFYFILNRSLRSGPAERGGGGRPSGRSFGDDFHFLFKFCFSGRAAERRSNFIVWFRIAGGTLVFAEKF